MIKILTFSILLICLSVSAFAQSPVRFYENAKAGYKDANGQVLVEAKYDAGSEFREGYAIVITGCMRGFIDEKGELAIPMQYDDASQFFDGMARVAVGVKNGYIESTLSLKIQEPLEATEGLIMR